MRVPSAPRAVGGEPQALARGRSLREQQQKRHGDEPLWPPSRQGRGPSVSITICGGTRGSISFMRAVPLPGEKGRRRGRVFFLMLHWRRQKTLPLDGETTTKSQRRQPHSVVFFAVCAPTLTTQRTSVSSLTRSKSVFASRAVLERPVSDILRPQSIALLLTLVFFHSLFSLFPLSLTLSTKHNTHQKTSRPPPRPWAVATTTAAPRSPQRPSSA